MRLQSQILDGLSQFEDRTNGRRVKKGTYLVVAFAKCNWCEMQP
jgi:hypothetical protein